MKWFINLPTRSKVTLGFGLVFAFLAAIVLTAFLSLRAERAAEKSIEDALEMRIGLNGQRAALLTALMLPTGPDQEVKLQEVKEYSAQGQASVGRLEDACGTDPQLAPMIEEIKTTMAEFAQTRDDKIVPMIRAQKVEEAKPLILGEQTQRYLKIRGASREITKALGQRSDERLARMEWIIGILTGAALLTGLAMVITLGRLVGAPLREITAAADKIADGDLQVQFSCGNRTDEIGRLANTFQRMIKSLSVLSVRATQIAEGDLTARIKPRSDRDVLGNAFANMTTSLRRIITELSEAVNTLASAAGQISVSARQLAATATETAAAVTETTATVEEMKQTSLLSSHKAKSVADESHRAATVAQGGKQAVDQTIEGMGTIREQMSAVADTVMNLSAQGEAIGEIISTVDDLAAQSSLLAVNAAIEAAKAGEEGKGFSVVAQEVKSLAEESKQATSHVRTILGEIQKATGSAVQATAQGSKAVEAGLQQSGVAGESISALAENVAEAAQAAAQIAVTSQQQFAGMDQVAHAMVNISTASRQAVASTREVEAAAQTVHNLGQKLKLLASKFTLPS